MNLNLRTINSVLINLDSQPGRLEKMNVLLSNQGISFDRFSAIPHERGIVGCGQSHYEVLKNLELPALVMEDDLVLTAYHQPQIPLDLEIPPEADAIYLGISSWGYVNPDLLRGHNRCVITEQYSKDWKRVYNMLAAHAVIYLKQPFLDAVIRATKYQLEHDLPWDIGLGSTHKDFIVLTPNAPFFFQEDQPEATHFIMDSLRSYHTNYLGVLKKVIPEI